MGSKILHLSDLHVGKSEEESKSLKDKIVKKIMADFSGEKMTILITGDIVDDGQRKQYKEAASLLKPLIENPDFNVWPIPGNHDYGWNGIHAERQRFEYFKTAFYPFENVSYPHIKVDSSDHVFIGLNSMKAECGFWDGLLADGELGSRQIHNVSGVLNRFDDLPPAKRKKRKVIVHLHHHPFLLPDDTWIEDGISKVGHWLKDGIGLLGVLAGRIDVLLFGHEHKHIDFSETIISERLRIPHILACGKSTVATKEYTVDKDGKSTDKISNQGLLGRLIEISDAGNIKTRTISF